MWPRISIVTPSYNQGAFIEQTIQSVLDQGYPNLEYIVIDGGSTDMTIEVIRKYEKHLAYWTSEKDRGAADAIAKGFDRASGDILGWLNSDDLFVPGALHAVAEVMSRPDVDVAFGNAYWIDSEGKIIGERRQTPFSRKGYLYGESMLMQPATLWKRDIYLKCGGIDRSFRFAFDTDLFFRFVIHGARFKHVNKCLASYRIHSTSKSTNDETICRQDLERIRQTYLPFPYNSVRAACTRATAKMSRIFWYILQGDLLWLIRRIPDRIRAPYSAEFVGPKGRGVK